MSGGSTREHATFPNAFRNITIHKVFSGLGGIEFPRTPTTIRGRERTVRYEKSRGVIFEVWVKIPRTRSASTKPRELKDGVSPPLVIPAKEGDLGQICSNVHSSQGGGSTTSISVSSDLTTSPATKSCRGEGRLPREFTLSRRTLH